MKLSPSRCGNDSIDYYALILLHVHPCHISPFPIKTSPLCHLLNTLSPLTRNKILSDKKYYRQMVRVMKQKHPELGATGSTSWLDLLPGHLGVPTFSQFVQHILDQHASHQQLNEHWVPASQFCTPCLVNYTVLAKVSWLGCRVRKREKKREEG